MTLSLHAAARGSAGSSAGALESIVVTRAAISPRDRHGRASSAAAARRRSAASRSQRRSACQSTWACFAVTGASGRRRGRLGRACRAAHRATGSTGPTGRPADGRGTAARRPGRAARPDRPASSAPDRRRAADRRERVDAPAARSAPGLAAAAGDRHAVAALPLATSGCRGRSATPAGCRSERCSGPSTRSSALVDVVLTRARSSAAWAPRRPSTASRSTRPTTPTATRCPTSCARSGSGRPALLGGVRLDGRRARRRSRPTTCWGRSRASRAQAGGRTLICSGDRDLYQAVDEHTACSSCARRASRRRRSTSPRCARATASTPAQIPDLIALRGDPSDGLPGAKGIGAKTAADLLARARVARGRAGRRQPLRPRIARGAARAGRRAARLPEDRDPPGHRRRAAARRATDYAAGAAAARELGMNALAARLDALVATAPLRAPSTGTPSCARAAGWRAPRAGAPDSTIDAVVHEDERVADLAGEADLVGDHDHRHAVGGQLAHHVEHLADELRVERRGRLVEQHQLRLHRQRAGDRHPLLLAAGELRRVAVGLVGRGRRARAAPRPRSRRVGLGDRRLHADRRLDDVLAAPSCAGTG